MRVAALALSILLAALTAQPLCAQAPAAQSETPQWQIDAGGKQQFDVASIKPSRSGDPAHANVNLSDLDEYIPTGGLLSAADFPLATYIGFAYKLTYSQRELLRPQLPKWATTDRFDIQARTDRTTTRDQMRLMMQSLLADRFKLAVHTETRQLPVFALVLDKPGKMGPYLVPFSLDTPCASPPGSGGSPTPPAKDDGWFAPCGAVGARLVSGRVREAARNLTMVEIAGDLPVASWPPLDRPVFDQTGRSGKFDFRIEFTPGFNGPAPPNFQPDPTGPTFMESLKEQLGLKLVPQTGPVDVLVIDHAEQPSEN
jgi:bla regulator protein blaR1